MFINQVSVGQSRDHNPGVHYGVIEMETMSMQLKTAEYDISYEMSLFSDEVDPLYRERLGIGV